MLVEYRNVRQIRGEGHRRWFSDEYFDLIVWYDGKRRARSKPARTVLYLAFEDEDARSRIWADLLADGE